MEDVYLATNVIKKGINILRVNDPDFIHLFHPKHCDQQLSKQQLDGCLKEFFNSLTGVFLMSESVKLVAIELTKLQNFEKSKKTKASHFGPSSYLYNIRKGRPTELESYLNENTSVTNTESHI